jgi:hypothetical protein
MTLLHTVITALPEHTLPLQLQFFVISLRLRVRSKRFKTYINETCFLIRVSNSSPHTIGLDPLYIFQIYRQNIIVSSQLFIPVASTQCVISPVNLPEALLNVLRDRKVSSRFLFLMKLNGVLRYLHHNMGSLNTQCLYVDRWTGIWWWWPPIVESHMVTESIDWHRDRCANRSAGACMNRRPCFGHVVPRNHWTTVRQCGQWSERL